MEPGGEVDKYAFCVCLGDKDGTKLPHNSKITGFLEKRL